MSNSFRVGDDATIVYPITDSEGGLIDWANPQVKAGDETLPATWLGDPATTRDLEVPLDALGVGTYTLWLVIPGQTDVRLGMVYIVEALDTVVPDYGGCVWPLDPACLSTEWDEMDPAVQNRAAALASSTLVRLTGGRVSNCPVTVRPVPRQNRCYLPPPDVIGWGFGYPMPYTVGGQWFNCVPCGSDDCSISLPAPVSRVDEVKVDGSVLDPSDYEVVGNKLFWMGEGACPFPRSQNVTTPDTEEGTMSVTYLNAYPVDSLGAYAAGVLAMEYARACGGASGQCRLPKGVTTIVKQGVTMTINSGAFPDGLTGIREVDTYIAMWNPRGSEPSRVWSPDIMWATR